MIGDDIRIEEAHLKPGKQILAELISIIQDNPARTCIGFGGESGSGKSTQALAFQHLLQNEGLKVIVFHMDDYFKLPPKTNHQERMKSISKVGEDEVDLKLLEQHIETIKAGKSEKLLKPLVDYSGNRILSETVDIQDIDVIIVEGTYVLTLGNIDIKIFMPSTYLETKIARDWRDRDEISEFNEGVLEIEHKIITKHQALADFILPLSKEFEKYSKS